MKLNWKRLALNVVRCFSVLSLLFVVVTGIAVNVLSWRTIGEANTIFHFGNRCAVILFSTVLILSEIEFPSIIFKWFPVLDENHSWAIQGLLQLWIGSFILGYDSALAHFVLPEGLAALVIVPGWFTFIIGAIYVLLGIFGGAKLKKVRRGEDVSSQGLVIELDSYSKPKSKGPASIFFKSPRKYSVSVRDSKVGSLVRSDTTFNSVFKTMERNEPKVPDDAVLNVEPRHRAYSEDTIYSVYQIGNDEYGPPSNGSLPHFEKRYRSHPEDMNTIYNAYGDY